MKYKALAYITRLHHGHTQLLVFTHRDFPEAGVQVPGGTVEPGEPVETALLRKIREESGLTDVRLVCQVAEQEIAKSLSQKSRPATVIASGAKQSHALRLLRRPLLAMTSFLG